ncbi:hypothetical protein ZONE111904_13020 [Zobellia nedashkovskayae]
MNVLHYMNQITLKSSEVTVFVVKAYELDVK